MDLNIKEITSYQTDDGNIHRSKNVARLHAASLHFIKIIKDEVPGLDEQEALGICTVLFEKGGETSAAIRQYLDLVDEVHKELNG